jgi:hypothetical protein
MPGKRGPFTIRHTSGDPVASVTVGQVGPAPMRAHIVEITAKVVVRSDTDPDQLPADIYSQISEFIRNETDILDLSVELFTLPDDLSGTTPH